MSLILYGSGSSLIVDFEECCRRNNISIHSIVCNYKGAIEYTSYKQKLIPSDSLDNSHKTCTFIVPLFTPGNRFLASMEAQRFGIKPYPLLSDANVQIPAKFAHGQGCFINTGVVLGSHSEYGQFVLLNRGANLGHHLLVEDYVSIGPGANIGGHVVLKRGAMIGVGAVILPKVTIGKHAIVGAGAVVAKNVNDFEVVAGNPARVIRHNRETEF